MSEYENHILEQERNETEIELELRISSEQILNGAISNPVRFHLSISQLESLKTLRDWPLESTLKWIFLKFDFSGAACVCFFELFDSLKTFDWSTLFWICIEVCN